MFNDLLSIIFPKLCACCGKAMVKNEELICLKCRSELPRTDFHRQKDNIIQKRFWGRAEIQVATSFLYFDKGGMTQKIIHHLKYQNMPKIGELMGILFGNELKSHELKLDCIAPVPLHPSKLMKRGYNQSYHFGLGISKALEINIVDDMIIRNRNTETQTHKTRLERWENVENVFQLNEGFLVEGKHILLVDDVVTTGATTDACAQILLKNGAKVSIAAIATTH